MDIEDVVPLVAMPVGGPTNALGFSRGPRWLYTGGDDGYVRKYNLVQSMRGEAPLTVAQRHQIVDGVTNGGVLEGYWENEVPREAEAADAAPAAAAAAAPAKQTAAGTYVPRLSPVYALANDPDGFWVLSGLETGGINLTSARMNEGAVQWHFRAGNAGSLAYQGDAHTDAVSCLELGREKHTFISGSWDKSVIAWDLEVGKSTAKWDAGGQVSSVEWRPEGAESLVVDLSAVGSGGVDTAADADADDADDASLFGSDDEGETAEQNDAQQPTASSTTLSPHTFLTATINGSVRLWDARTPTGVALATPSRPWTMSACWGESGKSVFLGGPKGIVREWDVRGGSTGSSGADGANGANTAQSGSGAGGACLREISLPPPAGVISALARVTHRYIVLGCEDNVRVYDLEAPPGATPYITIPSHLRGLVGAIRVAGDLVAVARGARGWGTSAADHVFLYKIKFGPREKTLSA